MDYKDCIDNPDCYDFEVKQLGACHYPSPLTGFHWTDDETRVPLPQRLDHVERCFEENIPIPSFELAGPRARIFHDPSWTRAAVVTCGGLCPGLNDVIKGLVNVLWYNYGVKNIFGVRYGYQGLNSQYQHPPIMLNPELVDEIHDKGGTILGSSRGNQPVDEMVASLARHNINILFCIGGDGTLSGAHEIADEIQRRGLAINVVGVPKTIDNDLDFMDKTFGFETAVLKTAEIITAAHAEANGAFNGIGLVKLMGRDSGFIAAHAALATTVVNFCLVPEMSFDLEGEQGLLRAVERRFEMGRHHAVIVVAEGAGQNFFDPGDVTLDASGNTQHKDVGVFLREKIRTHLTAKGIDHTVKYFDPSYLIRSVPALGNDAIFCFLLAANAVHAAMAGKTDMVVGHWNNQFTHVPIPLAIRSRKKIDLKSAMWQDVLGATRQNRYFQDPLG